MKELIKFNKQYNRFEIELDNTFYYFTSKSLNEQQSLDKFVELLERVLREPRVSEQG